MELTTGMLCMVQKWQTVGTFGHGIAKVPGREFFWPLGCIALGDSANIIDLIL